MTNPYAGQSEYAAYEEAWNMGYSAGQHAATDATASPPDVFGPLLLDETTIGYCKQVWKDGFLVGQQTPINPNVAHHESEGSTAVGEAGHITEGVVALVTLSHGHPVVAAVEVFLAIMVPTGAPRWEEEKGDLVQWFAGTCKEYSWEEFFIPVIWGATDEAPGWHGSAYRDFESAKQEADPHVREGHLVGIAHYRCDTPDYIEEIQLGLQPQ